ncbi:carboxynorspermidine decarboxylase [Motiliproteus sp.]|uniref:carboxynorspermidine decarboxylase n=1 Tax=Motiliproteus sp. TaxID=1898955 RepID=UPI003BAB46F7
MTIKCQTFEGFDPSRVPSPCFVVDEAAVEANLKLLQQLQQRSGAKVLAALKAFSCWQLGELTARYLSGSCASGLHEARLAREHYSGSDGSGEVHVYSAAYSEADMVALVELADHLVFNSFDQWRRFKPLIEQAQQHRPQLKVGLRINPEHSEGTVAIYDPCAPGSRLGIPLAAFSGQDLSGLSGLHFHTLCEQGFDALDRTLVAVERKFGHLLPQLEWINFGGGHWLTAPGYDLDGLVERIRDFSRRYDLQVYLEPGEAIAIHTGVLVGEVLDVAQTDRQHALLDVSATCHMPDTLEMPYRADIFTAGEADAKPHTYELGGPSCLAGDRIGQYSFDRPLRVGQRLLFDDMAHYTMVKTTTFNGVKLPAIAIWNSDTDELRVVREFGYQDFKTRLS